MKTRLEVVNQAAKRLGILAAGQTLAAEDYDEIDGLWEPLCEELLARGIYAVGDTESIEDAPFLSLADLLALKAGPVFGLSAEGLASKGLIASRAEDALEVIAAAAPTKTVLTIERFWG